MDEAPAAKPDKSAPKAAPGFSKLFDSLAGLTGFHAQSVKVEPVLPEPTVDEEVPEAIMQPEPVEDVVAESEEPDVAQPAVEEPRAEEPVEPEPEAVEVEAALSQTPRLSRLNVRPNRLRQSEEHQTTKQQSGGSVARQAYPGQGHGR